MENIDILLIIETLLYYIFKILLDYKKRMEHIYKNKILTLVKICLELGVKISKLQFLE